MTTGDPPPLARTDVPAGPPSGGTRAPGDPADRIVLVHGFTQNRRCWSPFDALLSARHPLRLLDAPGHGDSGHGDADLPTAAALLAASGGPGTWLGYSMGGRMALRVALDHPALVARLVLIGASPGLADGAERAARRDADERLAERLLADGLAAFLDTWLALPLFAGLDAATAHRAERLRNDPAGLAASLRAAGTGAQEPLWSRLDELTMPVLLLAGADDERYLAIAHDMAARIGDHATVAAIGGAGHTAHLEQPARTAATVLAWLAAREITS